MGKALGSKKYEVVVATKGGYTFDRSNRPGANNDPAYLRKALEASLKRLDRDYIDLCHWLRQFLPPRILT